MEPDTKLDPRFSDPEATPTPWSTARAQLRAAMSYQLTTVRPDGRPHQTTIAGIWLDEGFHFVTGRGEQKARNLEAGNRNVIVTAGTFGWDGLDVVIEGEAIEVTDPERFGRLVDAYATKYDGMFGFRLDEGRFVAPDSIDPAVVYAVRARKAFGFAKGSTFSQTRWRF
jgi:hypothetical protein